MGMILRRKLAAPPKATPTEDRPPMQASPARREVINEDYYPVGYATIEPDDYVYCRRTSRRGEVVATGGDDTVCYMDAAGTLHLGLTSELRVRRRRTVDELLDDLEEARAAVDSGEAISAIAMPMEEAAMVHALEVGCRIRDSMHRRVGTVTRIEEVRPSGVRTTAVWYRPARVALRHLVDGDGCFRTYDSYVTVLEPAP